MLAFFALSAEKIFSQNEYLLSFNCLISLSNPKLQKKLLFDVVSIVFIIPLG